MKKSRRKTRRVQKRVENNMALNVKNGYFYDKNIFESSCVNIIQIKEILCHKKSKFFDLAVFSTEKFGNVLVLDGSVQLSERDEAFYHEMIVFLPTNAHPKPENVLVIGGGDGGTLRELDRHPNVEKVTLCELDEMIIEVSKTYLKTTSIGFDSPKAEIIIDDGFQFLLKSAKKYDIIICDLSDPESEMHLILGHCEKLYTLESISSLFKNLNSGGILCLQSECIWDGLDFIIGIMKICKTFFNTVKYATVNMPIYSFGQLGFLLCTNSEHTNIEEPIFQMDPKEYNLRYYSPSIHRASFVLPANINRVYNHDLDDI